MSTDITIVIADDHAVVREGIRHVLAATPGLRVVGEAASAAEAVRLAGETTPNLVILDISMPDGSGLKAIEAIRRQAPEARVLMLSVYDQPEYVLESVRAGANGYLRKDTTPQELRQAVMAIHRGDGYFSPAVARHLTAAVQGRLEEEGEPPPDVLTPREREVLVRISQGLTNRQVATELGISVRTAEAHRDNLMKKLGIRTVAGLTRFAIKHGLTGD
jgi:DNA-binding NarL/FixJ family response regulator